MKFEDRYFVKFDFTKAQIVKNFPNALRDLDIAKKDPFLDVKFNYTYTALLKSGIALLSFYRQKVKSAPGHHIKIIEKLAELLKNSDIADLGNVMRSKRNSDLYDGGIEVTTKECKEYISFVDDVIGKAAKIIEKVK
ncbi:MAG: hypothetical protein ABH869_00325 [Candidatus Omnitrophota bacterium]